jgi:hypothetical protein
MAPGSGAGKSYSVVEQMSWRIRFVEAVALAGRDWCRALWLVTAGNVFRVSVAADTRPGTTGGRLYSSLAGFELGSACPPIPVSR